VTAQPAASRNAVSRQYHPLSNAILERHLT
jgi:hypothetical protein